MLGSDLKHPSPTKKTKNSTSQVSNNLANELQGDIFFGGENSDVVLDLSESGRRNLEPVLNVDESQMSRIIKHAQKNMLASQHGGQQLCIQFNEDYNAEQEDAMMQEQLEDSNSFEGVSDVPMNKILSKKTSKDHTAHHSVKTGSRVTSYHSNLIGGEDEVDGSSNINERGHLRRLYFKVKGDDKKRTFNEPKTREDQNEIFCMVVVDEEEDQIRE